ncbi:MAG: glycosyltransferase [Acholeplasma sp.]|nr:glycosyltransferase [Acholeplasma sp.]
MKLISFIVPVFNAEKYLQQCINSILGQSYSNLELILINDGSTDNSLNICLKNADVDSRIVVINKKNTGVSNSRNVGLVHSKGEYISFVDADDFLHEHFAALMIQEILNSNTDCVYCNYYLLYNQRSILKTPRIKTGVYTFKDINKFFIDDGKLSGILFGSVCSAIYKKQLIDSNNVKFDENLKINEDGVFNIEFCLNASLISVSSNLALYYYRQTASSSSKAFTRTIATNEATKIIEKKFNSTMIFPNFKEQISARYVSESFWHILKLCSINTGFKYKAVKDELHSILNDDILKENYKFINVKEINKYKRVYLFLMKRKMRFSLFFITRYIYPFLSRRLTR